MILLTGRFLWLDQVVSMALCVLIAVEAFQRVRQAVEVLLESTPKDVNLDRLTVTIRHVEGVETVHHLLCGACRRRCASRAPTAKVARAGWTPAW